MDGYCGLQHRAHSGQPRRRDRSYRPAAGKCAGATDLEPVAVRGGGGNGRGKSTASDSSCGSRSSVEESSFSLELRRIPSRRSCGAPIKALIDEEMSMEVEIRRSSPNLVARLMGLDTLPPRVSHKHQREMASHLQQNSPAGLQGKDESDERHSHWSSTSDHQEYKDVYEIREVAMVENSCNQSRRMATQRLKKNKKEADFIRQKFIDAKRLSTDEASQNSKELNDALEILDSNKDLLLKCLKEPDSLFGRHLRDLNCFPPSAQASNITILKSSKATSYGGSDSSSKLERKPERQPHIQNDVTRSSRINAKSRVSHPLKGRSRSHLSEQQYSNKTDTHPTQIVVLKPRPERVQDKAKTVSLPESPEDLCFGFKRHGRFSTSGVQELQGEARQGHKLFHDEEVVKHRAKCSREVAREVSEQMRKPASSSTRKVSTPDFSWPNRNRRSSISSDMSTFNNSEAYHKTPDTMDDWNSNSHSSPVNRSESSVSREGRKQLSEQWKVTQCFQEVGLAGSGSSTLGEMLALSDTETPRTSFESSISQKLSEEKSVRDVVIARHGCPSGISSQDGWKDGFFTNLPRSVSLPASSTVYGAPKPSSRRSVGGSENYNTLKDVLNLRSNDPPHRNFNRRWISRRSFKHGSDKYQSFNSCGEENNQNVREIHVNHEETINRIQANNLAGEMPMVSKLSDDVTASAGFLVEDLSLDDSTDASSALITEAKVQQPAEDSGSCSCDSNPNEKFLEVTSCIRCTEDTFTSQYKEILSSKEIEQPSPISVLECPSEEEGSSSTCFEKISADLHELRMQLKLLKLETDTHSEESVTPLNDHDTGGDYHSVQQMGDKECLFGDDTERDFSYIRNVLDGLSIHGVDQDRLFDASYLPECPVDSSVFENLEKKYGILDAWPRSERKLLFDHINSILIDIFDPQTKSKGRFQSIWFPAGLAEEVWQVMLRRRKELGESDPDNSVLDLRWLELADDVDIIGREMERMVMNNLLEELVSEVSTARRML